jgi:putative endonuclease
MAKLRSYFTYIMASKKNGTLYVGVTGDLFARAYQHKIKSDVKSFTARYDVNKLVYFEEFGEIEQAIAREKQLKGWLRNKKIKLIEQNNPRWKDLSDGWYDSKAFVSS